MFVKIIQNLDYKPLHVHCTIIERIPETCSIHNGAQIKSRIELKHFLIS